MANMNSPTPGWIPVLGLSLAAGLPGQRLRSKISAGESTAVYIHRKPVQR